MRRRTVDSDRSPVTRWLARSKPRRRPWVAMTSCARSTSWASNWSSSSRGRSGKERPAGGADGSSADASAGPVSIGTEFGGQDGGLRAPLEAELGQQVRDVVLDRLLGEEHPLADLPVGQALADQLEHGALLVAQLPQRPGRFGRPAHPVQHRGGGGRGGRGGPPPPPAHGGGQGLPPD